MSHAKSPLQPPDSMLYTAAAVGLLLALLPLPYFYYMALRLGIAVLSGYETVRCFQMGRIPLGLIYLGITLLFNPLIPVTMPREVWGFIDVGVALFFWQRRRKA